MNKLVEMRKKNGLTTENMAKLLGVAQKDYEVFEKNILKMPTSLGVRISQIFGVRLADIFL